jgi:hypothetical protein
MKSFMGRELGDYEEKLAKVYDNLLAIVRDHEGEMQPFERCNARKALGALWQIANGMDLDPGQLYDIGV